MSGVHLETKKIGDIQNDPKHVEKQKKSRKKIPERGEASPYAAPVEANRASLSGSEYKRKKIA